MSSKVFFGETMKKKYTVSEIAKLNNVNARTIRFFDSVDLFKPSYYDRNNGYRYYYIDKFEELDTIMYMRHLKIPISDIKEILSTKQKDVYEKKLKLQVEVVDEEIKKLKEIKKKIKSKLDDAKSLDMNNMDKIVIKDFPERKIYRIEYDVEKDDDILNALGNSKARSMGEIIAFGNVGVSLKKADLINKRYNKYYSVVVLNQTVVTNDVLKAGRYAVLRFVGGHLDAHIRYDSILKYLDSNHYKVAGDTVERNLFSQKIIDQKEYLITEIQVPIK